MFVIFPFSFLLYVSVVLHSDDKSSQKLLDCIRNISRQVLNASLSSISTFLAYLTTFSSSLLLLSISTMPIHVVLVDYIRVHFQFFTLCTVQCFFFLQFFASCKALLVCPNKKDIKVQFQTILCCLSFYSARSIQGSNTRNFQPLLESRKRWVAF